jgi:hypothetical protein
MIGRTRSASRIFRSTTAKIPEDEEAPIVGLPFLNSDAKCNTPGRFDIGKVDQDLEECCHAILRAFVDGGERPTWDLARCWTLAGGDLAGAGSG